MASSYAEAATSKPKETDEIEGVKPVFALESDLFGVLDPGDYKHYYIYPTEMYKAVGEQISVRSLTGLQRVRGLWRIYMDNEDDRKSLLSKGIVVRKKSLTLYTRNPRVVARESQRSVRVRVKDVPLSADDGQIIRALELNECEVITQFRERLRVDNFLTNCQTGDRLVICKPFDTPLPKTLLIGKYKATIFHQGQPKPWETNQTCNKCLGTGHKASQCTADWKCKNCGEEGHKQDICPKNVFSDMSDGEADTESETDGNESVESNEDPQPMKQDDTQGNIETQQNVQNEEQNLQATQSESQHSQSILGAQANPTRSTTDEPTNDKTEETQTPKTKKKAKRPKTKRRQEQITRYIPGQATGHASEAPQTPRAHKLTDCFDKSPITPPEVLHDQESARGSKIAKNKV